jgi:hypothetical protein
VLRSDSLDKCKWVSSNVGVCVLSASRKWSRRNKDPNLLPSIRCILLSRTNRVVTVLVVTCYPILHTFYILSTSTHKKFKCRKKSNIRIKVTSDGSAQRPCKGSTVFYRI